MRREDYLRFLSENMWVWREIPVSSIDEKLGQEGGPEKVPKCIFCMGLR
jgi:hypothetical protein